MRQTVVGLFERRPFFLLPLLGVFVGPVTGLSHYWVNDDVGHLLWVSGGFTSQPEYLNPVVGPIFGVIVSLLYRATTFLPWYPVAVLAIPTVACVLFLRFLKGRAPSVTFFSFVLVLTSGTLLLGLKINYTFASFVSCAVAALWMSLLVVESSLRFTSLVVPIILCILGLSLRTHWPAPIVATPPAFVFAGFLGFVFILMRYKRGELPKIVRFVALMSFVYAVNWLPQVLIMLTNDDWAMFIDFYRARGALNGVEYVGNYLASVNPQTVEAQTGVDRAGVIELRNWSLFDAESVSTESLRRLESAARQAQQQGLSEQFALMNLSATQFLQVAGWFALAAIIGTVARAKTVGMRSVARQFGVIGGLLFTSTVMVVQTTSGVRFPSYVLAGVVLTIALFLLASQIGHVASGGVPQECFRFAVVGSSLLVIMGCWYGFGRDTFAILREGNGLVSDVEYREQLLQSVDFSIPVVHNVMLVGYAYQSAPFDTSVPEEYLNSKNFGGGSNVRSPQYVRRWNYLTGENQTTQSLFNEAFYDRVMFENSYWYQLLFSYSKNCYKKVVPNQQGFATRVSSPCSQVLVADAHFDDSSYWWSKPSGMNLDVVARDAIDLDLVLLAPFGEHARPVVTNIRVMNEAGRHKYERIVVVYPGEGTKIEFESLVLGESVVIRSVSPCMIPLVIDPVRYPDRRELCVGLGKVAINGINVPLTDIRP